jgi:hypothetical protein
MDLPFLYNEHLRHGLPPEGQRIPVNAAFMEHALNVKSMPVGAVFPEAVTAPSADTLDYPWPQFFRGERGDFIFMESSVKSRAGRSGSFSALTIYQSASPANAFTITGSGAWQFVSFEKLWFASNGTCMVWNVPGQAFTAGHTRACKALGKHGRRLVLGGLSGSWFSESRWQHIMAHWRKHQPEAALGHDNMAWDESWMVYFEPGGGANDVPFHLALAAIGVFSTQEYDQWASFIDTAIEQGKMGLIPSRVNSSVYAIKELGGGSDQRPSRLISYGRDGISELQPEGYRYEETVVSEVGIAGRLAVGGTLDAHVAVDSQYQVVVVPKGGELQRLNHAGKLTPGVGSGDYIVSYDELFGDFWITEGTQAWVFNGAFTGPIEICPTGLVRDSAVGLLGFAANQAEDEYDWEIRFVPVDCGERDFKKFTTMMFEAVGLTDIEMKVDARYKGDDAWFNGPWIPAFRNNFSSASKSGVELRVSFRGVTTLADPARLSSLEARYVGSGGNVRRGPKPRAS